MTNCKRRDQVIGRSQCLPLRQLHLPWMPNNHTLVQAGHQRGSKWLAFIDPRKLKTTPSASEESVSPIGKPHPPRITLAQQRYNYNKCAAAKLYQRCPYFISCQNIFIRSNVVWCGIQNRKIQRIAVPARQQIWPRRRSKVTVKVTTWYHQKGLVTRNTHAKYQSSICNSAKVMAKVKVFVTDGQTDRGTDEWDLMSPRFRESGGQQGHTLVW